MGEDHESIGATDGGPNLDTSKHRVGCLDRIGISLITAETAVNDEVSTEGRIGVTLAAGGILKRVSTVTLAPVVDDLYAVAEDRGLYRNLLHLFSDNPDKNAGGDRTRILPPKY